PLGRSQNWKIGATRPAARISCSSPSSPRSSSVAGWVVAARGSSCRLEKRSSTVTGTPCRARLNAQMRPTGPPPLMITRFLSDTALSLEMGLVRGAGERGRQGVFGDANRVGGGGGRQGGPSEARDASVE